MKFVIALLLTSLLLAQEALTNESILKMVSAGLSENVIVSMVQSQPGKYATTPDDLVVLKQSGVPESVIAAMVMKNAAGRGAAATNPSGATSSTSSAAAGDPNDPMTPHDSGIYVYTTSRDGKPELTVLERASYQGAKTGGMAGTAFTYGIKKSKTKAIIAGAHASIRTDANPVFYFYFDEKAAGLGRSYFSAGNLSNPNQFALIKLEVAKSNRETVIGEFSAYGSSTGTNQKAMITFKSERLRPGLYKVTVAEPLAPGEYCFLASLGTLGAYGAGAAGAADLFDFGVSSGQ